MGTRPGDQVAEELAALRRVTVLVARGTPPGEMFAAVTAEVSRLLAADLTHMARYEPDKTMTIVAGWSATGDDQAVDLCTPLGGRNVATLVFETGRPARMDDYTQVSSPVADVIRKHGSRSSVGVPISVERRLWGVMIVSSISEEPLPADTEARLAGFTELVGTAIANAQARVETRGYALEQAALTASRARLVAAADEARRRIERDLHDGAQQRLVTLTLQLRELQAAGPLSTGELARRLDGVAAGLEAALEELRETARGIHPAVLAQGAGCAQR